MVFSLAGLLFAAFHSVAVLFFLPELLSHISGLYSNAFAMKRPYFCALENLITIKLNLSLNLNF
jgi:hypothetical protein